MESNHLSLEEIQKRLVYPHLFRLAYFSTLDSTNTWTLQKARQGEASGWVTIAESQQQGRGRYGRRWEDVPGKAILLSLLVKGLPALFNPLMLNYWVALQIAEALEFVIQTAGVIQLKWPNDILIQNKKLGGILIEGNFSGQQPRYFVIGIGLNINQDVGDFPHYLQGRATSLQLITGFPLKREVVIAQLLNRLAPLVSGQLQIDTSGLLQQYKNRLLYLGKNIEVRLGNQRINGRFIDLTDEGFLILQTEKGKQIIHSGEIFHEG